MDDKEFYTNIAAICEIVLRNANHLSFDVGLLNNTMIELDKRADKVGLKYQDLWTGNKK